MHAGVVELLTWVVFAPLGVAAITAARQRRIVTDRRLRTGRGWSARDTFEVLDVGFGAAAFFLPMALVFAFVSGGYDWPRWQWWTAMIGLALVGALAVLVHGHWARRRRVHLDAVEPSADAQA